MEQRLRWTGKTAQIFIYLTNCFVYFQIVHSSNSRKKKCGKEFQYRITKIISIIYFSFLVEKKKPMSKYKIIPEFVEILFVQIDE